jgi:hypothetical protein
MLLPSAIDNSGKSLIGAAQSGPASCLLLADQHGSLYHRPDKLARISNGFRENN